MKELEQGTIESSELVTETLKFWFSDNEHIRSPFPTYIQPELEKRATAGFYDWAKNLDFKAKDEINDEVISEKFEEIIFEHALLLVKTEDEKITIQYPFLPRLEDVISTSEDENEEQSKVIDRNLYKDGDHPLMGVKLEKVNSKEVWETQFQLPL